MSLPENSVVSYESPGSLPQGDALKKNIRRRKIIGNVWRMLFMSAIAVALVALVALIYNISNEAFGLVGINNRVDPATLSDKPLDELSSAELGALILADEGIDRNRTRTIFSDRMLGLDNTKFRDIARDPVKDVLADYDYPAELADEGIATLEKSAYIDIMVANIPQEVMVDIVFDEIVQPEVIGSWTLYETLTKRDELEAQTLEKYPQATFEFKSWVNRDFLNGSYSTEAQFAGVRTAILGSLYMILITMCFALPLGLGAAIYLEEYASDNTLNRLIKVNISNLAGVPSIVYGMLGLAIFVRAMENITSGSVFTGGSSDTENGRTLLAAGMTMALLILPIIIINAQEAIRAVPSSLRQASYGLGATKWQTVWHHVLPNALPGILTGSILAVSRAIGETAPLIVVGASTRIIKDPTGPFSKFTVLPFQIYRWTSEPQDEFRSIAAAAILVLLVMLLSLNSVAILLRNRFSRRYSA